MFGTLVQLMILQNVCCNIMKITVIMLKICMGIVIIATNTMKWLIMSVMKVNLKIHLMKHLLTMRKKIIPVVWYHDTHVHFYVIWFFFPNCNLNFIFLFYNLFFLQYFGNISFFSNSNLWKVNSKMFVHITTYIVSNPLNIYDITFQETLLDDEILFFLNLCFFSMYIRK